VVSKNYKKKISKKLIVSIVVLALVSVASILGIVTVLALTQRNIDSSIFIRFTAIDIDGEVEAAYRVGNADTWTSMSGETPHVFKASDAETNTQMNPGDITLTSTNNFVEFRYTFRNFGDADYTGILTLDEVVTENNMEIQYKYNDSVYSTSSYGLVLEGVDTADSSELKTRGEEKYTEMVYYVKVSVKELSKSANYSSDFFWLLERYDGEISGEIIPMSTSEFISNGDGTYSVRYKGANIDVANVSTDSSYKIENVWNIPDNFGSAPVTKVIKGDALPTNTKVILGGNISEIASDAFQADVNLVEIVFDDKLTTIPENAFKDCTGLKTITIPETVTWIGSAAFNNCASVEIINYSANYENNYTNGNKVFENVGQNANKTVVNINSVTIAKDLFNNSAYIDEINLSTKVKYIMDSSFYKCIALKSFEIPNSVITIKDYAFAYCMEIVELIIPQSVESIEGRAFYYCTNINKIEVDNNNKNYASKGNCLLNKSETEIIKGCITSVMPNTVTTIGEYSFIGLTSLAEISIHEGVTSIGTYAFNGCKGLTKIDLPNSLEYIGYSSFRECEGLTNIVIPDNVTTISDMAFYDCINLASVTIGSSVNYIGYDRFTNCKKLKSATFKTKTGWTLTSGVSVSSSDLANTSTAAEYLRSFTVVRWTR